MRGLENHFIGLPIRFDDTAFGDGLAGDFQGREQLDGVGAQVPDFLDRDLHQDLGWRLVHPNPVGLVILGDGWVLAGFDFRQIQRGGWRQFVGEGCRRKSHFHRLVGGNALVKKGLDLRVGDGFFRLKRIVRLVSGILADGPRPKSIGMHHHRRAHPIGEPDHFVAQGLGVARGPCVGVIQFHVTGVEDQVIDTFTNVSTAGRQGACFRQEPVHATHLVAGGAAGTVKIDELVESAHGFAGGAECLVQKVVRQGIHACGLVGVPHGAGGDIIPQSIRAPGVPGLAVVEPRAFPVKINDAVSDTHGARGPRLAGQVPVPHDDAVVIIDADGGALGLPAGDDLVQRETTGDEGRGGADDHIRVHGDGRGCAMEVIGIHAHVLVAQSELVDGGCHVVCQGDGPVTDAAHGGTGVAFTPASAVAGIHGNAVGVGLGLDLAYGMIDHQLAESGIRDAEFGISTAFAFPANEGKIFRMLVEGGLVGADDVAIGVPAVQSESLGMPVPGAPFGIRLVVVSPESPIVPDATRIDVRTFRYIQCQGHGRQGRDHFPGGSGEELAMSETVQHIPDGMLDAQISRSDQPDTVGTGADDVIFPAERIGGKRRGDRQRRELGRGSQHNAGRTPGVGLDGKRAAADPLQIIGQGSRQGLDGGRGLGGNDHGQDGLSIARQGGGSLRMSRYQAGCDEEAAGDSHRGENGSVGILLRQGYAGQAPRPTRDTCGK